MADRYKLGVLLGQGGMGAVYQATRLDDGLELAVKVILPGVQSEMVVPRFLREARLASRIHHPHVVEIHDSGRWGEHKDAYYLAMELVPGLPLSSLLDVGLTSEQICHLVCQILDALAHVHAREVLHRDIKPDNILVTRDEQGVLFAKVLDFGIAAALGDVDATRLTAEGCTVGTPAYMAPEQVEGYGFDSPALDLYPIGVLLYRMLAGKLPFEGRLTSLMVRKVGEDAPVLVGRFDKPLPGELIALVARLLARAPGQRPAFARDAKEELQAFAMAQPFDPEVWSDLTGLASPAVVRLMTQSGSLLAKLPTLGGEGVGLKRPALGRDREMAELEEIAMSVEKNNDGRLCIVEGEAGIGKSMLIEEFGYQLAEAGRFQVLRCMSAALEGAGGGLRAAIDRLLGTGGRGPSSVEHGVRAFLRQHGEDDAVEVQLLVAFLRPEVDAEHEATAEKQFAVLTRCLRRIARRRPVLISIDDLNLGGAEGIAFIEFLLSELALDPFPILVLGGMRSSDRNDTFTQELLRFREQALRARSVITLGPLAKNVLVDALMNNAGIDEPRAQRLASQAAGNPLYAFLLASHESGEGPTVESDSSLSADVELPEHLRGLLKARLQSHIEALPDSDRCTKLLEVLAVLGGEAQVDTLEPMLDDEGKGNFEDDLDAILDAGLAQELPIAGQDIIQIQPPLLGSILYSEIGRRKRRRLHREAAKVLSSRSDQIRAAAAARIGDHFEQAQELEQATQWWVRAAETGSNRGSADTALRSGRKALKQMSPTDPTRPSLSLTIARLLLDTGNLPEAIDVARPILASDDHDLALCAVDVLSDIYENVGFIDDWNQMMSEQEYRVERSGPVGKWAWGCAKTLQRNTLHRFDGALAYGRLAVDHAEPGLQAYRAWRRLSFAASGNNEIDLAVEAGRRCLEEAGDNDGAQVEALRTYGWALHCAGRLDESQQKLEQGIETCRRVGRMGRMSSLMDLTAQNEVLSGKSDEARARWVALERLGRKTGMQTIALFSRACLIAMDLDGRDNASHGSELEDIISKPEAALMANLGISDALFASSLLADGNFGRAQSVLEEMVLPENAIPFALWMIQTCAEALLVLPQSQQEWSRPQAKRLFEYCQCGWEKVRRPELAKHCQTQCACC